jgi:hypothetical protein
MRSPSQHQHTMRRSGTLMRISAFHRRRFFASTACTETFKQAFCVRPSCRHSARVTRPRTVSFNLDHQFVRISLTGYTCPGDLASAFRTLPWVECPLRTQHHQTVRRKGIEPGSDRPHESTNYKDLFYEDVCVSVHDERSHAAAARS